MFVLQYVQPGLAGLMDGSVSTLAPLFAAAFATHKPWETFLVGLAASVGAGISMGFAEALSDDGSLTGRGTPWLRGAVCGVMTTIGGLGHTLPYLIPDFWTATVLAFVVVIVELAVDLLDPLALHGHAVPLGGVSGHGRRRAGVRGRHSDREFINRAITARCSCSRICPTRTSARSPSAARRELINKRGLGLINWYRKRHRHHRADVLDAIVRRHAGAAAGPHRGDRRSREHLARRGIRPRRELARHASARRRT